MARIVFKLYEQNSAEKSKPTLILVRQIETDSAKQLTGKRAAQLVARHFPEFKISRNLPISVIKFCDGWRASRASEPTSKCSYHFVWHFLVVTEEKV